MLMLYQLSTEVCQEYSGVWHGMELATIILPIVLLMFTVSKFHMSILNLPLLRACFCAVGLQIQTATLVLNRLRDEILNRACEFNDLLVSFGKDWKMWVFPVVFKSVFMSFSGHCYNFAWI